MARQLKQKLSKLTIIHVVLLIVAITAHGRAFAIGGVADLSDGLAFISDVLILDETYLTVGLGPQYSPDYFGSDDYSVDTNIEFKLRFRNFIDFDNGGAAFTLLRWSNFSLGPLARIDGGRSDSKNEALEGLGDVNESIELGVFLKLKHRDRYSARLRYRHAVGGGHQGGIVEGQAALRIYQKGDVVSAVALRTAWVDQNYADSFYRITPAQAADSINPVFEAVNGFRDTRLSGLVSWTFAKNWTLNGYARYAYIHGPTAQSPIIEIHGSRHQFSVGAYVAFTFRLAKDEQLVNDD